MYPPAPMTRFASVRPFKLLFGGFVGISCLLAVGFLYSSWQQTRREMETEVTARAQQFAQSLEAELQQFETVLELTGERLVEAGVDRNPENGRAIIESVLKVNRGMVGFGLARADGQLVLVSNVTTPERLPNLLEQPESADSFRRALEQPGLQLGRTYYMPALQRWLIPARVVLRRPQPGRFVMTAGFDIWGGKTALNVSALPEGMELLLVRDDGYVQFKNPVPPIAADHADNRVARLGEDRQASETLLQTYTQLYSRPVAEQLRDRLLELRRQNRFTVWDLPGRGGDRRLAHVVPMDRYGLSVVVSQPAGQFYRDWGRSVTTPLLVWLGFLGLATVLYRQLLAVQLQGQQQLVHQALHDPLTDLPNRRAIANGLSEAIARAKAQKRLVGVLFLDLDRFKRVNDNYGHDMGDRLLCAIAQRLRSHLPQSVQLGRQGGDEFILVVPDGESLQDFERVAQMAIAQFEATFEIEAQEFVLSTSVGMAVYPFDGFDASRLLGCADTALYASKERQRGCFLFYDADMNRRAQRRLAIERELRKALQHNEFQIYYQPQVDASNGAIVGGEALVRWQNPHLGWMSPAEFIPIAEDIGAIAALGGYVLDTACADLQAFQDLLTTSFHLSVNVSAKQLLHPDFVDCVRQTLDARCVDARYLTVEITESVLIDDLQNARQTLLQLQALGVTLSIDDFGTGYSSLSYINTLPVSELKIDRSFICNMLVDNNDAKLTRSIVALGQALGVRVVAEGVEERAQMELLQEYHCAIVQGYYISKPLSKHDFIEFLARQQTSIAP